MVNHFPVSVHVTAHCWRWHCGLQRPQDSENLRWTARSHRHAEAPSPVFRSLFAIRSPRSSTTSSVSNGRFAVRIQSSSPFGHPLRCLRDRIVSTRCQVLIKCADVIVNGVGVRKPGKPRAPAFMRPCPPRTGHKTYRASLGRFPEGMVFSVSIGMPRDRVQFELQGNRLYHGWQKGGGDCGTTMRPDSIVWTRMREKDDLAKAEPKESATIPQDATRVGERNTPKWKEQLLDAGLSLRQFS